MSRRPSTRVREYIGATTVLDAAAVDLILRGGDHDDDNGPELPAALDPETPSVLYLTSGTTGTPKIVTRRTRRS